MFWGSFRDADSCTRRFDYLHNRQEVSFQSSLDSEMTRHADSQCSVCLMQEVWLQLSANNRSVSRSVLPIDYRWL